MPSAVEICNLALADLGDSATVASIDPPEGSAQAEHCARFYPVALAALQELHAWSFCTRRESVAEVANPSSTWLYAYALPAEVINILAVLDPAATDDYSTGWAPNSNGITTSGVQTPQPYVRETDADGNGILLTNQAAAVVRYTAYVTDTTKFTPLFVLCLSCLLRSMLAGPVLKGADGRSESKAAKQEFATVWLPRAAASDASDRDVKPVHTVGWMAAR
jgi:hypothetical protein